MPYPHEMKSPSDAYDLRDEIEKCNKKYGLTGCWKLKVKKEGLVTWKPEGTEEENRISARDINGLLADISIYESNARQSALGLGRLKEMRRHGFDLGAPPQWSLASTPILAGAIKAHTRRGSKLAEQEIMETQGVITCYTNYEIRDTDDSEEYHFSGYDESLRTAYIELPETVWSSCAGKSFSEIFEVPGVDLSGVIILDIEKDGRWIPELDTRIIYLKSPLVRFADPPPGEILSPEEAWLQEAKK